MEVDPEELSHEQLVELESVLYSQLHHTVDGQSSHPLPTLPNPARHFLVHTGEISMVKQTGFSKQDASLLVDNYLELPKFVPNHVRKNYSGSSDAAPITSSRSSAKSLPASCVRGPVTGKRSGSNQPVNHGTALNGHFRACKTTPTANFSDSSSLEDDEVQVISSEDSDSVECEVIASSRRASSHLRPNSRTDVVVLSDSSDVEVVALGKRKNNIRNSNFSKSPKIRFHASYSMVSDILSDSDSECDDVIQVGGKRRCLDSGAIDSSVSINITTSTAVGGGTRFRSAAKLSAQSVEDGAVEPLFRQLLTSQLVVRSAGVNTCPVHVLVDSAVASRWSREQRAYYHQRRRIAAVAECAELPRGRLLNSVNSTRPLRYYNRHSLNTRCRRCPDSDHSTSFCPRPIVCHLCGNEGHSAASGCPNLICYLCGSPGHQSRQCRGSDEPCRLCHVASGHSTGQCPDLWRRYHCTVSSGGRSVVKSRALLPPWSCDVRPESSACCHRCGRRGHFGHHCKGEHLATAASISQQVIAYDGSRDYSMSTAVLKVFGETRFQRLFAGERGDSARRRHVAEMEARAGASLICQRVGSYWLITARADSHSKAHAAINFVRKQCSPMRDSGDSTSQTIAPAKTQRQHNRESTVSRTQRQHNRERMVSKKQRRDNQPFSNAFHGLFNKPPSRKSKKRQKNLKVVRHVN